MKIEIEITSKNLFLIQNYYEWLKSILRQKAVIDKIRIKIERK